MIRIKPYYDREPAERREILKYYLNLVADVVPFRPDDVLDGFEEEPDSLSHKARGRSKDYKKLLEDEKKKLNGKDERTQDALMAEILIKKYSEKLHKKLYGEGDIEDKPGAVNRKFLHELLTIRFLHGAVPDDIKELCPSKPSKDASDEEKKRFSEATKNLREYVFCYDDFAKKKEAKKKGNDTCPRDVYRLLEMLGVEVCPYCNRQYITTVAYGTARVRPQLDHFRNKKDYPFLALSINNLVPSCSVCNLLKHDKDKDMLYPYDEGIDDSYVFRAYFDKNDITTPLTGAYKAPEKIEIKFDKTDKALDDNYTKRIETSRKTLALDQLYQSHSGYVADLLYQRYVFTDKFFEDTKKQFPKLFKTKEEVKHMVRLMDYSSENWGKRPLSKLTHDISEQIDELYKDEIIQGMLASLENENDTE